MIVRSAALLVGRALQEVEWQVTTYHQGRRAAFTTMHHHSHGARVGGIYLWLRARTAQLEFTEFGDGNGLGQVDFIG